MSLYNLERTKIRKHPSEQQVRYILIYKISSLEIVLYMNHKVQLTQCKIGPHSNLTQLFQNWDLMILQDSLGLDQLEKCVFKNFGPQKRLKKDQESLGFEPTTPILPKITS